VSQVDAHGFLWICIDTDCPELCADELETGDMVAGGVSTGRFHERADEKSLEQA